MTDAATSTRTLTPQDLGRVIEVDGAVTGRSRRAFYERRFGNLAAESPSLVALAADRDGHLAGFAFAHLLDGEFGGVAPVGVVDAIGVDPKDRRAGVAGTLLGALEAALATRGARELRTEVDWTERALVGLFAAAGFRLSPRLVLERTMDDLSVEDQEDLENDEIPVRSMTEADLGAIVRLDRRITGRERAVYYRRKADEVLKQSGIRVSLVAEIERQFAGFLMARVDFGEFGRADPVAVLDTIGVDPTFARQRVGRALLQQLLLNLRSLRVEQIVTQAEWNHLPLVGFLARTGFRQSQRLCFAKPVGAGAR